MLSPREYAARLGREEFDHHRNGQADDVLKRMMAEVDEHIESLNELRDQLEEQVGTHEANAAISRQMLTKIEAAIGKK